MTCALTNEAIFTGSAAITKRAFPGKCGVKRDDCARKILAASSAVTACGAGSADEKRKPFVQLAAMKQEPNTEQGVSLFRSV